MTHSKERQPYEFDQDTKLASLVLHGYLCAVCHEPERPDDRFEFNHAVAIWFAKEIGGALSIEVIRSLANCEPVHHSCHRKIHKEESRAYYQRRAVEVFSKFLELNVDHSLDDWRYQLGLLKSGYGND